MPKNKKQKYERVKHLPNVKMAEDGELPEPMFAYPWYHECYTGMPRILELGCGKGEYSLAFAAARPESLVVGVDYKSHRMCVGAEKAIERELGNVYFLRARVERIREFFRPHSIHEIWLTFPDPHLKNRKAKCRLTAAPFLGAYSDLLVPGGVSHLKTDSDMLYRYTRESVIRWGGRVLTASNSCPGNEYGSPGAKGAVSAYEKVALSRGTPIKYMAFKLS